ncbi:MAG: N5-carboxyaminoimidazole ribonucleotide mutase [Gemmatimonadota bacterium]|nr:MAG: N5-carboxyaminoimidazole ribonucleotide mutase [Gemmatimonadota bacterium]
MSHKVLVMIGSKSDTEAIQGCLDYLDRFGIPHEFVVSSAHRAPERTRLIAEAARENGFRVIICGAGMAAHLPGVVASLTTLPVIGVPLAGSHLSGVDSLHAIVQMPPGVPVATMAIGSAGGKNAAIFAAQILALSDESLAVKLSEYKLELAAV